MAALSIHQQLHLLFGDRSTSFPSLAISWDQIYLGTLINYRALHFKSVLDIYSQCTLVVWIEHSFGLKALPVYRNKSQNVEVLPVCIYHFSAAVLCWQSIAICILKRSNSDISSKVYGRQVAVASNVTWSLKPYPRLVHTFWRDLGLIKCQFEKTC